MSKNRKFHNGDSYDKDLYDDRQRESKRNKRKGFRAQRQNKIHQKHSFLEALEMENTYGENED